MKKIIKNKVYDTATAKRISKALYCKKTGEYFLHGGENKKITPLSHDEAREWAENNLKSDIFVAEFGESDRTGTRATINISILPEIRAKLERLRKKSNGKKSISRIIEEAVEKYDG
jgi:uncharacterized protein YdaT